MRVHLRIDPQRHHHSASEQHDQTCDDPDKNRKETLAKRYGYRMEDLLNPSKIGMYQFTVDHKAQETTVTRLIPEEYGFRVPTFSKTFKDLINETADLEDEE